MSESNPLMLLRGPLIVFGVVSALLAPYLAQLSLETVGLLSLLVVGLGFTLWDAVSCISEQSRTYLSTQIDKIVLDDILKAIFDPEVGLIANCVGCFLGSSAMYSVATTEEQRVRLMQSGLWVRDPEIARNVLYQPGGIKLLFPPVVLEWLEASSAVPPAGPTLITTKRGCLGSVVQDVGWTEKCHESSDDESVTALYDEEKRTIRHSAGETGNEEEPIRRYAAPPFAASVANAETNRRAHSDDSQTDPPWPHEVLGSILMENVREKLGASWNDLLRQVNRSTLTMTACTATLLLVVQLKTSRRARSLITGALQSLTAIGLSSIAVASGAMICASHWDERKLSLSVVKDMFIENWRRNWKGWLVALFMLYMKQRQGMRPRR